MHLDMSKYTLKKFYKTSEGGIQSSSCRLCLKICDVTRVKKLFRPANANILKLAEDCLGDVLVRDICKPCERRLTNYKALKDVILKSQNALKLQLRAKRCPEPSPSSLPARKKIRQVQVSSPRRSLSFSLKENLVSFKT